MERVAGEFDRLGGANRNPHLGRVHAAVQFGERIARARPRLAFANYDERRLVEIADGRAFPHEFRVGDDMEVPALSFSGGGLDLRHDDALDTARQHRAADNDRVRRVLAAERFTDFARHVLDVSQVGLSTFPARGAHANEGYR